MTINADDRDEIISSSVPPENKPILKIEVGYGDGFGGISSYWVNSGDWGKISDEDWNNHLLVNDEIRNGLLHLVGHLGPVPDKGWAIKFWLDIKDLPQSTFDAADKDNWESRGFMGPAPPPSPEFLKWQKEREELRKIGDPNDFSWIKVKKYDREKVEKSKTTWEEKYKTLLKHHEAETKFLIEKCGELASKI